MLGTCIYEKIDISAIKKLMLFFKKISMRISTLK